MERGGACGYACVLEPVSACSGGGQINDMPGLSLEGNEGFRRLFCFSVMDRPVGCLKARRGVWVPEKMDGGPQNGKDWVCLRDVRSRVPRISQQKSEGRA